MPNDMNFTWVVSCVALAVWYNALAFLYSTAFFLLAAWATDLCLGCKEVSADKDPKKAILMPITPILDLSRHWQIGFGLQIILWWKYLCLAAREGLRILWQYSVLAPTRGHSRLESISIMNGLYTMAKMKKGKGWSLPEPDSCQIYDIIILNCNHRAQSAAQ